MVLFYFMFEIKNNSQFLLPGVKQDFIQEKEGELN